MDDIRHQTTLQIASLIDVDDEDGIDSFIETKTANSVMSVRQIWY